MPAWLLWTLLTLAAWGGWAFLSRLLGDALSAQQNQALSTLGFLPVLGLLVLAGRARLRRASRRGLLLAFAGGVLSCLANIPYYAAAARGERFAAVVSLVALAPVVTVLLALLLLRERLGAVQVAGLALAFAAIWLFNVSSGAGLLSPTVLVALPPILLWGLSGFLQKVATQDTAAEAAALAYLGAFVPMGIFYALREPWPAEITGRTWALVVALGFLLAFGNFTVIAAYAAGGQTAVVAPLVNLFPVISIGLALLLLGEKIGPREAAGVAVALASVAALSRETPPQSAIENLKS